MSDVIVKYRAQTCWHSSMRIDRMEFVRETDKFLVDSRGSRHAKVSNYGTFFDTWADAHAELVRVADANQNEKRRNLELAQSYVDNVRGMKEPV